MKFLACFFLLIVAAGSSFGQEVATEFKYPLAVAASADGTVYVADRTLPGIWKLEGDKKTIYFQASKKFRTPLNAVRCLAFDHQENCWQVILPREKCFDLMIQVSRNL